MQPHRKPTDLTPPKTSSQPPLHAVPGAGPPTPSMARDLPELLHFRDRALSGEVESRCPSVLAFDLPSTTFQKACLATLANLRGLTVIELVQDHLARGYEADLVCLGRQYCPERVDLFESDDQDEASQSRVARVLQHVMSPLPLEADWAVIENAFGRDREGGQIRLELFVALVDWRCHLISETIALCARHTRAAQKKARAGKDLLGARALGRLAWHLGNVLKAAGLPRGKR